MYAARGSLCLAGCVVAADAKRRERGQAAERAEGNGLRLAGTACSNSADFFRPDLAHAQRFLVETLEIAGDHGLHGGPVFGDRPIRNSKSLINTRRRQRCKLMELFGALFQLKF